MPEQDVDGGPAPTAGRGEQRSRERILRRMPHRTIVGTHHPEDEAALDRYRDFIAAQAKVEALREQPCRSLIGTDCMTLAVEHPSLGGDHDMCRRCTPLAAAEAARAALQRDQEG